MAAYVWEYVKTPYVASTIDLVSTHKYEIKAVSSHSYGIRIYGTKRSNGQEDLLFSTKDFFMTPFNVSGALYSSVRIANDLTGGTTGIDLSATILVRMPIADNDRDNPNNVWEYIYLPYATRTVNIESTHKYRFTAYSSLNYGLRFYGVRRSDGKEQLLLETESTFDTLETSGALYSSIRISNMHGRETGLGMSGHLLLRMPLNSAPTIAVTTGNNLVATEGQTIRIEGNTMDVNNGNVLTVKYQINTGTARAAQSGVSNGSTPLSFSKVLTYRGGRLYEGSVDVSGLLAEGTNHTVTIWAEDDQGGKSDVVTRTFTVKHNKAPILTVGTFPAVQSGLIPPDSITLSGTASDPDGNTITVKGKLNSGTEQTVLSGVASGNWLYSFKVSDLKAGANTVTITSTDQFGLSTVKTFNVNNAVTETPMKKSVARYKILAPKGSTREILAWLKREKGNLVVDAEASFVDKGLPEQYTAMTKESVDLTTSISEDELLGAVATAKSDVMFKLTLSRTNTSTNESAVMLVGVIS
ncbi:hypothetical protein [Brevibacillus laterosporus]|uniref:Uncharacterized protein n=1 Tax=Brevibacillus laterosporus TaxID=1465 RepID=A0AAP3DHF8_BRELA|nr:hypothetical protein [Brevibacillus laterosporus]MCR8981410.1 hypothetical protein [Brevibacillus laterosporus]MCZ0808564.1 hypothetical protein [Brevibacillus laterosporus]MCZ0826921.1 hypothetical protein [Brevibacillus laterosporus]MCZ0850735.1 hypothetical protein [Brevibacillus laterosporus]